MTSTELKTVGLCLAEETEIYREVYQSVFPSGSRVNLLDISTDVGLRAIRDKVSTLSPDVLLGTKKPDSVIIAELQKIREDFPRLGTILLLMTCDAENINLLKGMAARGEAGMAVFLKQ